MASVVDSGVRSPLEHCRRDASAAASTAASERRPGVRGPTRGLAMLELTDEARWDGAPPSDPAQCTHCAMTRTVHTLIWARFELVSKHHSF